MPLTEEKNGDCDIREVGPYKWQKLQDAAKLYQPNEIITVLILFNNYFLQTQSNHVIM